LYDTITGEVQPVTPQKLAILSVIRRLSIDLDDDTGVGAADIADALGRQRSVVYTHISDLLRPIHDPYVERKPRGGVVLTERGELELSSATSSPYATPEAARATEWIDRHRWPWLEEDSLTENVAIPTCTQAAGINGNPEDAAHRHNRRLLPDDVARRAWDKMRGM